MYAIRSYYVGGTAVQGQISGAKRSLPVFEVNPAFPAMPDKMVRRHPHVFGPDRGAPLTRPEESYNFV